jgi:hypothetical protein
MMERPSFVMISENEPCSSPCRQIGQALQRAGIRSIERAEVNEAFAAISLAFAVGHIHLCQ